MPKVVPFEVGGTVDADASARDVGSRSSNAGRLYRHDRQIVSAADALRPGGGATGTVAAALSYEKAAHVHDIAQSIHAKSYGGFGRGRRNDENSFFSTSRPSRQLTDHGEAPGPGAYFHGGSDPLSVTRPRSSGSAMAFSSSPRFGNTPGGAYPGFMASSGRHSAGYSASSSTRDFIAVRGTGSRHACARVPCRAQRVPYVLCTCGLRAGEPYPSREGCHCYSVCVGAAEAARCGRQPSTSQARRAAEAPHRADPATAKQARGARVCVPRTMM